MSDTQDTRLQLHSIMGAVLPKLYPGPVGWGKGKAWQGTPQRQDFSKLEPLQQKYHGTEGLLAVRKGTFGLQFPVLNKHFLSDNTMGYLHMLVPDLQPFRHILLVT